MLAHSVEEHDAALLVQFKDCIRSAFKEFA
jgi:hypothetical protein